MTKERFFEELENKIKNANCFSDRAKKEKLNLLQELKNINSDNVDSYKDVIRSFSISCNGHFYYWLEAITEYEQKDFDCYICLNGQNNTEIAVKAIKGTLEVPHLSREQINNLETHLEKMKTESCEMTEKEWSLTRLASIEKGFIKNEWLLAFLYNPKNISNCEHCIYKNDTSNGCGQQNCWVKVHCR